MRTIRDSLREGKEFLQAAAVDESELSAQILLAHLYQIDRAALFARANESIDPKLELEFRRLLEKRATHCPIAYLTGEQEFFGYRFEVSPVVLIPRPETELLVTKALEKLRDVTGNPRVIDVGTGSGCIAVSLAKQDPRVQVLALDKSLEALELAEKNAKAHHVEGRIQFAQSDLLGSVFEMPVTDLIVSNPPYIAQNEKATLMKSVRDFEPALALFAPEGEPADYFHRRLIQESAHRLRGDGWLLMEVGMGQAENVAAEIRTRGFGPVQVFKDYAGIERVVAGKILN